MIVLDTHIWVWWIQGDERLSGVQRQIIQEQEAAGLGISAISCWEVAKLVERGRLQFSVSLEAWFEKALSYPGIQLLGITPEIAIASTRLPGEFHRDPADQLIVATARVYDCALVTSDMRISSYPHVESIH